MKTQHLSSAHAPATWRPMAHKAIGACRCGLVEKKVRFGTSISLDRGGNYPPGALT